MFGGHCDCGDTSLCFGKGDGVCLGGRTVHVDEGGAKGTQRGKALQERVDFAFNASVRTLSICCYARNRFGKG